MAGTIDAGRLVFHVDADASKANAQLATYQDKLRTTEREISNTIQKINQLEKEFAATGSQKAAREIDNLKSKLQTLNVQAGATSAKISEINRKTQESQGIFSRFGGASMIAVGAITSLAYAAGQFIANSVRAAAQVEQWATSFRVLTGDAQTASTLLQQIRDFGAVTPFETSELIPAAQQLLGMGIAAEDIMNTMQMIGDVSAGLSIPLGDLSYLYGQIQSQGRAMTQDLNQFAARGIPIYRTLAEMLNTDVAGVRALAEQGRISSDVIAQAFGRMTQAGGQFAGMMEAQSQTLNGRISTLKDNFEALSVSIGEALAPSISEAVNGLNQMIDAFMRGGESEWVENFNNQIIEISESVWNLIPGVNELTRAYIGLMDANIRAQDELEQLNAGLGGGTPPSGNRRPPGGGSPGGGSPGGGGTLPDLAAATLAADEAMQAYENQYKNMLIVKAEADRAAEENQIKAQKEHWEGMLNIAQTAMTGIIEIHQMATNAELQKIENDYNQKKKWIKENVKDEKERAKQLEKLEEEKEKKIAAVKAKYAKEQKALMLMNAIVQTAAGITSALAMSGPPWVAIAMAAIVGAIGAAQIGLIAATPVPQAQYGGSFTVPPGYEADSGLLRVNSGERVDVTPERFSGDENRDINISIDGESMRGYISREINRAVNSGSVQIRRRSAVRVS
jgi:tape measure domain-containing protein